MTNKVISSILINLLLLIACNNSAKQSTDSNQKTSETIEQNSKSSQSLISSLDKQFSLHDPKYIKVFIKKKGSADFVEVKDFNNFPEDVEETINLFQNPSGKVLIFKDVPASESGDYSNTYTHYFDENGKTIAFKNVTSFFGSDCDLEDATITEERLKYFDASFNLVKENYKLNDENGKAVDSTKCTFNYRSNPQIYSSLQSIPIISKLKRNN